MRLITKDDLFDTYGKLKQRGLNFISSKFNPLGKKRTISAFDDSEIDASNWWSVPLIKKRWNKLITENENQIYEDYIIQKYLADKRDLKMVSLGSGVCNHEIHFAQHGSFSEVLCVDFASSLLEKGREKSRRLGLTNIHFSSEDVTDISPKENYYDVVLFHSSLHHFKNVEKLIQNFVFKTLKQNGLLIFHEYVGPNRLQFPSLQIKAINEALQLLPENFKVRYKTNLQKKSVTGPGIIRMYLADPSECVDSSAILQSVHKYFSVLEEKPIGGNILMFLLKDISHHLVLETEESLQILKNLFEYEDNYLRSHPSDFVFGVYQKS